MLVKGESKVDTREKYKKYVNTGFLPAVDPLVIDRAEGATYFGADGSSFIDCFAGISVVNTGHANKTVLAAARRQMERLVHCSSYLYHVEVVADLAEKLARITPGDLQKTFFGNSGAEAIEGAARLAKRYSRKNEAIALTHSFHGRTYATLSLTGNATRKRGGGPYMPGVAFAPAPYCYRCPLGREPDSCGMACARAIDDVINFHTADNVAYFVAEPLLGEGGLIVPPDDYFKRVKEVLDEHDVLFIADEVQSGFCRTGKMFAIEHYGVEPDIMAMAKGIANGFPLGAFIAREEIADAFEPGDHLTTFGGNPVSVAAALANIGFMEDNNLSERAAEKGERLMRALHEIKPKRATIGEIRGRGLMIGIEMVEDARSKRPAVEDAKRIKAAMRDRGVLLGLGGVYGNVLRIQPPLTISAEELDTVLAAMSEVLEA
jgi:4-aminobutyrate aminotransferase